VINKSGSKYLIKTKPGY